MIEFVIAYDEEDVKLGSYFRKCRDQLVSTIEGIPDFDYSTNEIQAKQCNRAYLDIALQRLDDLPFIITAYMHGNFKQLVANGGRFVDADEDNTFFSNTLFYTNSCSSGKLLGPSLISDACRTFIGFDQEVYSLLGDPYEDISVSCDNHGISAFLTDDVTAYSAYQSMKDNYTQEIKKLNDAKDVLRAGILISAREALVFHGDQELKKADLQTAAE